ncbi:SDR family NAD(P)-dependent oxidoreductase [soil metagenome]
MSTPHWALALVTGASSGIGDHLARQLAAAGSDLIVVARSADKLRALADELDDAHGVTVEVLPADLADAAGVHAVEQRLATGPAVDLLVNNAGVGTSGDFATLDLVAEISQIALNITALVRLTHAVLPAMIERGSGAVLNVSSLGSLQPLPGYATYGATKAFVTSFGEALHEELRGTGVSLTTVLPGFTRTEFQARAGVQAEGALPGLLWGRADVVASEALAATARGRALVIPGNLNKAASALTKPLPRGVKRRLVGAIGKRF